MASGARQVLFFSRAFLPLGPASAKNVFYFNTSDRSSIPTSETRFFPLFFALRMPASLC